MKQKKNYVEKILTNFVKECSRKLKIDSIIQFGSSTYSKNFHDIDLILISNNKIFSFKDILKLRDIIFSFERKYSEVVFDFSGLNRKKKGKYSITVVYLGKKELNVIHNPHDIFFRSTLIADKNKKVLYGEDFFKDTPPNLTKQHMFELLSIEQKHALRKSLDDKDYMLKASCHLLKTFLRVMLINNGNFKKENLLKMFEKNYKDIKLPKNSGKILSHKLNVKDFEDILEFTDECLKFLVK